jgi:hypothetical protein
MALPSSSLGIQHGWRASSKRRWTHHTRPPNDFAPRRARRCTGGRRSEGGARRQGEVGRGGRERWGAKEGGGATAGRSGARQPSRDHDEARLCRTGRCGGAMAAAIELRIEAAPRSLGRRRPAVGAGRTPLEDDAPSAPARRWPPLLRMCRCRICLAHRLVGAPSSRACAPTSPWGGSTVGSSPLGCGSSDPPPWGAPGREELPAAARPHLRRPSEEGGKGGVEKEGRSSHPLRLAALGVVVDSPRAAAAAPPRLWGRGRRIPRPRRRCSALWTRLHRQSRLRVGVDWAAHRWRRSCGGEEGERGMGKRGMSVGEKEGEETDT